MDIAQKVAERIKEEQIKPIPRRFFVVRSIGVWSVVAATVALTGVASGVMVYILRSNELDLRTYTGNSLAKHLLQSFPYFWVIVVVSLLALAVMNSRLLKRGYSVRPAVYAGLYGVTALLLGTIIAETGKGAKIEDAVAANIPLYDTLVVRPSEVWFLPEHGFISGHIDEFATTGMVLKDCYGGRWLIKDRLA